MRIPLDYYRILGVPIQASVEQLQQAYRDRILQLPRREYSEMAIAARKELLDEAYGVLRDAEQRSTYDGSFLTKTYDTEANPQLGTSTPGTPASVSSSTDPDQPSIEIKNEQFVGALLILQELGEYELVLKLGRAYLNNLNVEGENGQSIEEKIFRQDVILTIALACLELGREQWQQRRYEEAAGILAEGQESLLREGLFTNVRGELQADLYKLRPYRILELLALPENNQKERQQGLHLLREMLQERGGMEGTGDDQSGLSTDDFLRFIQQLRSYITSAEQQTLFEEEARRPSAVATYLAVYALVAGGFTLRQPALIRHAKQMLMRLGKRQDVHLEQAVCALLMGQTEEASHALELSGEYESLAFIREHSQGAPDLLPGLCLYSERWLQTEVFPHFRDLAQKQVSLKDYFADEKVQTALETLPPETEAVNEWEVLPSQRLTTATATSPQGGDTGFDSGAIGRLKSRVYNSPALVGSQSGTEPTVTGQGLGSLTSSATATAMLNALLGKTNAGRVQTLSAAERVTEEATSQETQLMKNNASPEGQHHEGRGQETPNASSRRPSEPGSPSWQSSHTELGESPLRLGGGGGSGKRGQRSVNWLTRWRNELIPAGTRLTPSQKTRLVILGVGGALGAGLLLFLLVRGVGWAHKALFAGRSQQAQQPVEQVTPPPPPEPTNPLTVPGPLTKETAQQVVEVWLSRKADAFGSNYEIEKLNEVLVSPVLSQWQGRARTAKRNNWYRKYEHSVDSNSLQIREVNSDQAKVDAKVHEVAQHYKGNQQVKKDSYDSTLRVRYDLVRQNGQWYIQDMTVLK